MKESLIQQTIMTFLEEKGLLAEQEVEFFVSDLEGDISEQLELLNMSLIEDIGSSLKIQNNSNGNMYFLPRCVKRADIVVESHGIIIELKANRDTWIDSVTSLGQHYITQLAEYAIRYAISTGKKPKNLFFMFILDVNQHQDSEITVDEMEKVLDDMCIILENSGIKIKISFTTIDDIGDITYENVFVNALGVKRTA